MAKLHMGQLDLNTKQSFSVILEFSILRGDKGGEKAHFRAKLDSKTKLYLGRQDLNTKELFLPIFEFFNFYWSKGKNTKFRKIWILKHNSALNYLTMTKVYIGQLDMYTKNYFTAILEFSILRIVKGGGMQNIKIFGFLNITRL